MYFLPLFIAVLLGLASPNSNRHTNCHQTVTVNSTEGDPGDGEPGDGDPGDGTGDPGTGGGVGQNPPPKP